MIPIVNQKYKYIVLYCAKSGCTSLRSLYLSVHKDEMNEAQLSSLNWYHNLNELQPFDTTADYSDYFVYSITRNPYTRVVSAFLDQYAYARNKGVQAMFNDYPPSSQPNNFVEFLEYLKSVPDADRDGHFQTQSHFPYTNLVVTPSTSTSFKLFGRKPKHAFGINLVGDISKFRQHTDTAFKRIFKRDKAKYEFALEQLDKMERRNASFYGNQDHSSAAELTVDQLNDMVFAPKPQDFYTDPRAIELVNDIYHDDFVLFAYPKGEIPRKSVSKEIDFLPDNFQWEVYLHLNPDVRQAGNNNERSAVRHYLEFGRFEQPQRVYRIETPKDFQWQRYLELNADLVAKGIVSEQAAVEHYVKHGVLEERPIC